MVPKGTRSPEPAVFTLVATGQTLSPLSEVEAAVRAALAKKGVELIPCAWAPDPDTIADAANLAYGDLVILDLN